MNTFIRFLLLSIISLLISFLFKRYIFTNNVYFNSLLEKLSYEQVELVLNNSAKWEWLAYCLIPVIYFFKFTFIAICLNLGLFLIGKDFKFGKIFNAVIKAEFVFFIPSIIKLMWFLTVQTNFNLRDLEFFYPLSALNMFDQDTLEPWLVYPLQVFNVFEIIYWIALAYFLSKELPELDMDRSMMVVMSSYGTGLIIWIAFVMFLTLTYT